MISKIRIIPKYIKNIYYNIELILIYIIFISINVSFGFVTLDLIKYDILTIGTLVLLPIWLAKSFKREYLSNIKIDLLEIIWFILLSIISVLNFILKNEIVTYESIPLINLGIYLIIIRRILNTYNPNFQKKIFLFTLYSLGVYQAIFGIFQYICFEDSLNMYKTLVTGTIIYFNCYGSFMVIALSTAYILIKQTNSIRLKIILMITIPLFISVIYLNLSRGAILSAFIALIVTILFHKYEFSNLSNKSKSISSLFSLYSISLFCVIIIVSILLFNFDRESSIGRLMILKIAQPMLAENFWSGIGLGNFEDEYLAYQQAFFQNEENIKYAYKATETATMNNQFLKYFIELGFLGGCMFILFWIIILFKSFLINRGSYKYWFTFACTTLFFHSLLDSIFSSIVISSLLIFIIAFLPIQPLQIKLQNKIKQISFWSIILFLIYFIYLKNIQSFNISRAYKYEQVAALLLPHAKYQYSQANSRLALALNPSSIKSKYYLGRALIGGSTNNSDSIQKIEDIKEGLELLESLHGKIHYRDYYLALSYGFMKMNKIDKAKLYANYVHKMFREQLRPQLLLGILNYYDNHMEEGKKYLETCFYSSKNIHKINYTQINRLSELFLNLPKSQYKEIPNILDDIEIQLTLDSIFIAH